MFSASGNIIGKKVHIRQAVCLTGAGSFDPEVMSIIYLINSIGKTNTFQASLLAWIVTFGRHLIPRAPREQVYLVHPDSRSVTLIPLQEKRNGMEYAGKMLRRGSEILAR